MRARACVHAWRCSTFSQPINERMCVGVLYVVVGGGCGCVVCGCVGVVCGCVGGCAHDIVCIIYSFCI